MEKQGLGNRGWGFGALLALAILLMQSATAFAAASGSGGERELGITWRVYNYAHVGRGPLIAAEKQAARIFRQAGVAMRWCNVPMSSAESLTDSGCEPPPGPATLDLRIVPRLKVMPGVTTDSSMGFAAGNLATVSYHWIKDADPSDRARSGDMLPAVIAHEIGHLLLGPNSHSPTGIMTGEWSPEVLRAAGQCRLVFTPQQAELLRAQVLARSGRQPQPE